MTWEEVTVPAIRGDERLASRIRFAVDDVCLVEVWAGDDIDARGEGPDLFEALVSARRELEARDVLVGCNGARRDVFPSPMLRQAVRGRRAYVLTLPRTTARPPTVDVFAAAPDLTFLATVDEQRAWFDRWRQSGLAEGESP
jgi:hypothetical protein